MVKSISKAGAFAALFLSLCGFAPTPAAPTAVAPPIPAVPAPPVAHAANPPAPAATPGHALTAEDAGAWFDGLVPDAINRGDIAGAVVVVVKDGQVLFQRGYGYSDIKARKPVDAETTMFRPGSVSKTFTWTAVMQLVQAGKIDLDADINTYLDFKIPPYQGKPMTMRQIMTHSEGFSDAAKDLITADPKQLRPLGDLLRTVPARIFPPGEVPAYSNYGASVAGYVVQRVSGEPFDAYIANHIFAPLGMTHATFSQPLPEKFKSFMATGYKVASVPPDPYEIVQLAPAGSLAASGGDMARFMIAHLNDGEYQGQRILEAKTAQLMHAPAFTPVSSLGGMALGFYQEPANGHRVIAHAGDTNNFHSDMHLYLDDHVGLFLSFNSAGALGAAHNIRSQIFKGFTDRYFSAPPPQEPTWKDAKADGQKLAGLYVMSRRSDSGWLRIAHFLLGEAKITVDKDGIVTVPPMRNGANKPKKWREVGPFAYREVGGDARMGALVKDGQVKLVMSDDWPPVMALQPVSPIMSEAWNKPLFFAALGLLGIGAVTWPLAAIIRRRYGHKFELSGREATLYRLTRLTCVVNMACVGLWLWFVSFAQGNLSAASSANDWIIRLIQLVGLIAALGTLAALANAAAVLRGDRGWFAKVSSLAIALACVAAVWFQLSLHLLTLNIAY
jgi:CubicO group peptidase (beta-lactamase class C family)